MRLLLFADRWEELYTLCPDEAGRSSFIAQLLEAARAAAVSVVLTLRGDFMDHALANGRISRQTTLANLRRDEPETRSASGNPARQRRARMGEESTTALTA